MLLAQCYRRSNMILFHYLKLIHQQDLAHLGDCSKGLNQNFHRLESDTTKCKVLLNKEVHHDMDKLRLRQVRRLLVTRQVMEKQGLVICDNCGKQVLKREMKGSGLMNLDQLVLLMLLRRFQNA